MTQTTEYFEIRDLLPIGLTLVVLGIGIAYGLNVQEDVGTDFEEEWCSDNSYWWNTTDENCYNSSAEPNAIKTAISDSYNASQDAITGVAKLPEKMPLIVTVIVAAVIIGILVRYLMVRFG